MEIIILVEQIKKCNVFKIKKNCFIFISKKLIENVLRNFSFEAKF